jgi:hypothetical protein
MHKHRLQKDGKLRDSDNWQKGIPLATYMKSLWRHFFDFWSLHRGISRVCSDDGHELDSVEAGCSILFNVMGYLHETIKAENAAIENRENLRQFWELKPTAQSQLGGHTTFFNTGHCSVSAVEGVAANVPSRV